MQEEETTTPPPAAALASSTADAAAEQCGTTTESAPPEEQAATLAVTSPDEKAAAAAAAMPTGDRSAALAQGEEALAAAQAQVEMTREEIQQESFDAKDKMAKAKDEEEHAAICRGLLSSVEALEDKLSEQQRVLEQRQQVLEEMEEEDLDEIDLDEIDLDEIDLDEIDVDVKGPSMDELEAMAAAKQRAPEERDAAAETGAGPEATTRAAAQAMEDLPATETIAEEAAAGTADGCQDGIVAAPDVAAAAHGDRAGPDLLVRAPRNNFQPHQLLDQADRPGCCPVD